MNNKFTIQKKQRKSLPAKKLIKVPPSYVNKKEKLACLFYLLASIYYFLQLAGKLVSNINITDLTQLVNFIDTKLFAYGLQVVTIAIMLLRKR